nr:hypothetical protein [Tanacetum cinerariifolium]
MDLVTPPRATVFSCCTYEVRRPSTAASELPFPVGCRPSVVADSVAMHHEEIRGLCVRVVNLEHAHGTLTRKMGEVSDAQVEDNIAIGEIWPKVATLEGRVEVLGNQHDLMVGKIVEVESQVLRMQDREDTHLCEQVLGLSQQYVVVSPQLCIASSPMYNSGGATLCRISYLSSRVKMSSFPFLPLLSSLLIRANQLNVRFVLHLGDMTDSKGIHSDPAKVEAMSNWVAPTILAEEGRALPTPRLKVGNGEDLFSRNGRFMVYPMYPLNGRGEVEVMKGSL